MSHAPGHGRFVWTELLTRNRDAALAFYPAVAGWTVDSLPMSEGSYTVFLSGGAPHAGLLPMPEGVEAPANWLPYVSADDVDAAVVRCQEEGGAVLAPPRDIAGVGRFAVLADPAGAAFAVYRAERAPGEADPDAGVGQFCWREVGAREIDASCDFYREMFGWKQGPSHDMGESGLYQVLLDAADRPFAGVYVAPPGCAPAWTGYVRVERLEPTIGSIEAHGGRVEVPPMAVPGGSRIAICADPEGVAFGILEMPGS